MGCTLLIHGGDAFVLASLGFSFLAVFLYIETFTQTFRWL